jgi:hypothetical protein
MRLLATLAVIPLAALLVGAKPSPTYISLGKYDEGLVIPVDSPVRFKRFGQYDRATFNGRFVLEGLFIVDCSYCEPGYKDNRLHLGIVPDPAIAARLPRWKRHDNDIAIDITDADRFIRSITTATERQRLMSGEIDEIRGRAALVVDHYEAGLDCDSANYSARFVAIAKPTARVHLATNGDYGCGWI